jgi:C4-dicarboxylate-specific signal transduction histidine kinase
MNWLRSISIQWLLVAVILMVSAAVTLFACAASVAREVRASRARTDPRLDHAGRSVRAKQKLRELTAIPATEGHPS